MNAFLKKIFFLLLSYFSLIESVIKKNFTFPKDEIHMINMKNGFEYLMYITIKNKSELSKLISEPSDELIALIEEVAGALNITDIIEVMIPTDKMFLLAPASQLIVTQSYRKGKIQVLINEAWLNTLTHDQKKFIIAFNLMQCKIPKSLLLENILNKEETTVQEYINTCDYISVSGFMSFLYSDSMKDFYKDKTILGFSIIQNAWWQKVIQSVIVAGITHVFLYGSYTCIKKYAYYYNKKYYITITQEILKKIKDISLNDTICALIVYNNEYKRIVPLGNDINSVAYDSLIVYIQSRSTKSP